MRTEIQYQAETNECALACLAMVASYLGIPCYLEDLRQKFVPRSRGTTAADIITYARKLNLQAYAVRCRPDALKKLAQPAILHWKADHFIVFEKLTKTKALIVDPAVGRRIVSKKDFATNYSGVAIIFENSRTSSDKKTFTIAFHKWKRALSVLQFLGTAEFRARKIYVVLLIAVFTEAAGLASPLFISSSVNLLSIRHTDLIAKLALFGGAFGILALIQGFAIYVRSKLIGDVSKKVLLHWTERAFSHLLSLPLSYFLARSVSGVTGRLASLASLQTLLTGKLITGALDFLVAFGALIASLTYAPWAAGIAFLFMVIYGVVRVAVNRHAAFYNEMHIVNLAMQDGQLVDSVKGIATIKAGLNIDDRIHRYRTLVADTLEYQQTYEKYRTGLESTGTISFALQRILLVSLAVFFVSIGRFSVGALAAMVMYLDIFSMRLSRLIDSSHDMVVMSLHLTRLADITNFDPEAFEPTGEATYSRASGDNSSPILRFDRVLFRHRGSDKSLFENITLEIGNYEHVVITGKSGEGKTTLLLIAAGLLTATDGTVCLNERTLHEIGTRRYREQIGVVLQDDRLFPGTILENIASFTTNPSNDLAMECCRTACIAEDIHSYPLGLLTRVSDDGTNFSGGQRQRLCLARALYKRPKILILDESSSSLDPMTERLINVNLASLNIAILSAAHRMETIKYADRVLLLEQGEIKQICSRAYEHVAKVTGTTGRIPR